ncbi:MAG: hypothetical protein JWN13_2490 [Betaproteobacteria bacterium]|nr:hypothetical protein [Betaproteobacteria bacterium]
MFVLCSIPIPTIGTVFCVSSSTLRNVNSLLQAKPR